MKIVKFIYVYDKYIIYQFITIQYEYIGTSLNEDKIIFFEIHKILYVKT